MGDTVKVTIIATGFAKDEDQREPAIDLRPGADFFTDRPPVAAQPAPASAPPPEAPAPPPVAAAAPAPVFEDELDVPAYLRQGKLLN
jgi:pyruvate/2-oxoglutarate dehydrogenase complex dihydrolipoamide acyltransferase (E2) component